MFYYIFMEDKAFVPYIKANETHKELTVTSIVMGIVLAIVFGAANAYLGLRVGMTVSASIPAAVISMGVVRIILRRDSILENNMVQTIGSAGESLAAGAIFTMPALFLWAKEGLCDAPSLFQITALALCGGILGVLFMIPLRRSLIVKEHGTLGYPEGTACADVLKAGEKNATGARQVFSGMGFAAVFKFIEDGLHLVPCDISIPFKKMKGEIGVEVYPALLGVGYIIGPKISSYMAAGSLLGWMVLIPMVCLFGENVSMYPAAEGTTIGQIYASSGAAGIWSGYIKYIGAGAIATGGIISLIKSLPMIIATFKDSIAGLKNTQGIVTQERTDQDLKINYCIIGIIAVLAAMVLIPAVPVTLVWTLMIAVAGFFFATVAARMVGIVGSSNNPVSGMTIATLLITTTAIKAEGGAGISAMIGSLAIASVVCTAAAIAADTSQDLKTGFLLGATPWKQQIGELIGVAVSAVAIGGVLYLLDAAWGYGSKELSAPQATLMKMIIEGIMGGKLPWTLVFIGVFIGLTLEMLQIPVMPVAIGLYLPIYLNFGIMAGGVVRGIMDIRKKTEEKVKKAQTNHGILYCAGMIAGEGLVGILLAVFAVLGLNTDVSGAVNLGSAGATVLLAAMIILLCRTALKEKK